MSTAGLLAAGRGGIRMAAAEGQASLAPDNLDPRHALIEAARVNSPHLIGMTDGVLPQLKARGGAIALLRDEHPSITGSKPGAAAWGTSATQNSTVVWGQDFLFVTISDQTATLAMARLRSGADD